MSQAALSTIIQNKIVHVMSQNAETNNYANNTMLLTLSFEYLNFMFGSLLVKAITIINILYG